MTKKPHNKATPDQADDDTPPTMAELGKQIDAAVREVAIREQAVAEATADCDSANQEYAAAVDTLNALHAQFETIMQNVLSHGGTVHIAKG